MFCGNNGHIHRIKQRVVTNQHLIHTFRMGTDQQVRVWARISFDISTRQ